MSLLCLATHPRVQYTHSLCGLSPGFLVFCKRSVKCADGNNLGLTSNPEDGCFYSLDFLWCQRRRCSPESPHADCNCCQRFITFCTSGFLIANWNILDSWAQWRFQSCSFLHPMKGTGSLYTARDLTSFFSGVHSNKS